MFLEQPKDLLAVARRDAINGQDDLPTGFTENVSAAFDYFRSEESSDSARRHWEAQLNERATLIEQLTGAVPDDYRFYYAQPFDVLNGTAPVDPNFLSPYHYLNRAKASIDKLREQHPEIPTDDELRARIPEAARLVRDRFQNVTGRAEGHLGTFVGMAGGAVVDPLNLASMVVATPVVGARALGILARTLRAAKIGATAAGATEAAVQPFVYDFKQELGVDYSVGDALAHIAAAGTGGAVLFGLGVHVPPLARSSMRGLTDVYRRLVQQGKLAPTPEADSAARVVETLADITEANPLAKTIDGHEAHLLATEKAMNDLADGRIADVTEIVQGHEPPAPRIGRVRVAGERTPETAAPEAGATDTLARSTGTVEDAMDNLLPTKDTARFADEPMAQLLTDTERAEATALLARMGDDFVVPVELRRSADGSRSELLTVPARELVDDIERRQTALASLITCIGGGAGGAAA